MCTQQQNQNRDAGYRIPRRPCSGVIKLAVALSCLCPVPAVLAQDAVLEEILVTASKKGETNLLNTAVTATVVTGEQLEIRKVRNVSDLQFQTPGLVVDDSAGAPRVAIRGVGHDGSLMHAENGVAV